MITTKKSRSKSVLKGLRAALIGAVAMSAASVGSAFAGSIEFWTLFSGPDGAAIDALVKNFNATAGKEASVEVKLLIIPWDDFNTKLSVAMASRKAPALTVVNSDQVPVYAKQNALDPFTAEELTAAGIDQKDYVPAAWAAGAVGDKQFGVPISIFPRSIYYNKTLFEKAGLDPEKAPTTGAEVMADAKAIAALGDGTMGLFFNLAGAGTFRNFYSVYWQYEDSLYNADMTNVSDTFTASATKALTALKGFIDAGVTPAKDIGPDAAKLFAQNKIGIAVMQITDLPVYQAGAKDLGLKFGIAGFPQFGDKPAVFAMAHEFLIPRGTTPEARADALTFIKWIGENGVEWAKTGKVSPQYSVIASDAYKALPEQSIVTASIDTAHFPAPLAVQPAVDKAIQQILEEFYAGRTSVDEAVAKMAAAIPPILAKN
jgi:multiple sugar transport system substrate-binding protein